MAVNFLRAMFEGLVESDWNKNRLRENRFNELNQDQFLFSSNHLKSVLDDCETKEEVELILDHMYKFNACEIDSYKELETKIIDKFW